MNMMKDSRIRVILKKILFLGMFFFFLFAIVSYFLLICARKLIGISRD